MLGLYQQALQHVGKGHPSGSCFILISKNLHVDLSASMNILTLLAVILCLMGSIMDHTGMAVHSPQSGNVICGFASCRPHLDRRLETLGIMERSHVP